ncbi:MAG: two-component regulator propeller domain-containing protein [Saprospiraceae bacterium]
MKIQPYLPLFALALLFASCKQKTEDPASPALSQIEEAVPIAHQGEPHFLITASGDSIPTGVPIPAKGTWINPDSVAKPKTISYRGKTKVAPVQTNIRPAGTPKVVPIPKDLKVITPGENGVPRPKKVPARGVILPVLHSPSIPASPLAFKDDATASIQYLSLAQGLVFQNIQSIFEDSKGDIWFGGGGGVCRYDGVNFTYFTPKEGFPLRYVWFVFEDSRGIFWFGSERNGLCRYDGVNFTHYTTKEGLNSNWVWSILEDEKGYLWFGTKGGVSRYDPHDYDGQGSFTHFTTEEGLIGNNIRSIFQDSRGHFWFGSSRPEAKGVCRYDPDAYNGQGRFTHYTAEEGLIGNDVTSIFEDSQENIWFGTWGNGVCSFDGTHFKHYTTKEGLASNVVMAMIEDTRGNLWFGGLGGTLYKPDANEGRGSFTHFTREEGMSGDFIIDILKDNQGNIWFGMVPGGVNRYHPTGFTYYTTKNGLTQNTTRTMFKDSRGAIWIGHLGGVTIYEPGSDSLGSAKFIQYSELDGRRYWPRMEDSRGNVWMYNPGLIRYTPDLDRKGGRFTHFTTKEGLSGDQVITMREDKRGNLWFATNNGVSRYVYKADTLDRIGGNFTHFTTKEGLSGDQVTTMLEDKRGNLWFATNNGLSCYTPDDKARDGISGYFTHFAIPKSLISDRDILMLEDSRGNLWLGSRKNGVYRFVPDLNAQDAINGGLTHFTTEDGLIDNNVRMMMEDSDGNIWFGTENGVSRFAPDPVAPDGSGGSFTQFTTEEGLSGNEVGVIIEDKQKNIWISTTGGISLLIPLAGENASSKTGNYQIMAYNRANGLKQMGPAPIVVLDSSFNRIWWGSNEGLSMLDLNQFQAPKASPAAVRLNTIEIKRHFIDYRRLRDTAYQGQVAFGEKLVGSFDSVPAFCNYPLNLSLPYSLNHLTFHFSAIDWQAPYNVKYHYIMEGLDDEWSPPGLENKADYRKLPPGSYTFKVKAIGAAQIESTVFAYDFRILPPWWLTWWAYTIYGGLILLTLYGIRSYEIRRYRAQSENRRLKELDSFKTRLYANITHEFRTPLTIILGMVRQIKDDPKRWYNEGLQMITRNGWQLLGLVNQMLDLSKLDKGKLELKMQHGEVVGFIHYLVQSFESFAAGKNIHLHFLKEIDRLEMDFDPDQLTKVASNLLSNAVKYTPEGGQVYVAVRSQASKPKSFRAETLEVLELRVKDTGPGIPPEELPRIFDRFYQMDSSATRKAGGTGLGLALTKELVQLMGGEIRVQSKIGEGTDFSVLLPVNRSAPKTATVMERAGLHDLIREAHITEAATADVVPLSAENRKESFGSALQNGDLPLVLLIEDNRDVLTYIASCLQASYQLEFAMNGQEGIEQALEIVPDVIISDLMMPEKDGYEVCAALKKDIRTSHIPIILLTAKADQDAKLEGLKAGADAYLVKPFDKKELNIRLEKLLDLRRQLQARYSNLQSTAQAEAQSLSKEDMFLKDLREAVEENLSDESFGVVQLCRKVGMSRSQLHNKLKALTNQSASIYIRAIRLEKAKELLRNTDLNISEVAYEVGFRTALYFTQVFSEEVGVAPSVFRINE